MTRTLDQAIRENRTRWHRRRRAEKLIIAIRWRIFEYEDAGQLERAERVIERLRRYAGYTGTRSK